MNPQRHDIQQKRGQLHLRRIAVGTRRAEIEARREELENLPYSEFSSREIDRLQHEVAVLQEEVMCLHIELQAIQREAEALREHDGENNMMMDMSEENQLRREHHQTLLEAIQTLKEDMLRQSEALRKRQVERRQNSRREG